MSVKMIREVLDRYVEACAASVDEMLPGQRAVLLAARYEVEAIERAAKVIDQEACLTPYIDEFWKELEEARTLLERISKEAP